MALFSLMNSNSAVRIYRIETDKKTDTFISQMFKNQTVFFENNYNIELPFDADYSPSSNECSSIKPFSESVSLIDAINRSTAIPKWSKTIGLENISALFMATDYPANPKKLAIQAFSKKQILQTSNYVWLSNGVFSLSDALGFNIDDKVTAIIDDDKISFRNFNNLRSIFDMNRYFSDATQQDLDDFVAHPSFDIPTGFSMAALADNVVRKKIILIKKSGILTSHSVSEIVTAAGNLNFNMLTSGMPGSEQIVMPSTKKEIKDLLYFLAEDYFNAEITKQRFRSNSKRKA